MLNFLTNIFNATASARNVCGDFNNPNNVIQECGGCDGECLYTCYSACANECQGNTVDAGGNTGPSTCNNQCTGTCFSLASILGIK